MPLIVEDGSIVANANSYNDRTAIIEYAALRGVVLPDDDTTDVLAVKASDYLETFRAQYKGAEVAPGVQTLSFPREGLTVGWFVVGNTVIPAGIKNAQCQLCIEQKNGIVLTPSRGAPSGEKFVTKKQIGPIVTEWSEAVALAQYASSILPEMPAVEAMLAPYLRANGPTFSYRK